MKEFRTKAGTILPIMDLKGKPYLQVAHRIVWFREEHPDASIDTSFVSISDSSAVARAVVSYAGKVMSTAHKREDAKHFGDFTEKAETGAIGRALALLGYGTQFTGEDFEEGDRLADSPIAPVYIKPKERPVGYSTPNDPVAQGDGFAPNYYIIPFGKWNKRTLEQVCNMDGPDAIAGYISYLEKAAQKDGKPIKGVVEEFINNAAEFLGSLENAASVEADLPF